MPDLTVCLLHPDAILPVRAHPDDAGLDVSSLTRVTLAPGERALVRTGVALAVPTGFAVFVHPRSGLAAKHGITIVNAPGTIDSGYRGEVKVCLLNTDRHKAVTIRQGDKIAQLVMQRVEEPEIIEVETIADLGDTERGAGGFGSTGGVSQWTDAAKG